jgi:hypothetical protein
VNVGLLNQHDWSPAPTQNAVSWENVNVFSTLSQRQKDERRSLGMPVISGLRPNQESLNIEGSALALVDLNLGKPALSGQRTPGGKTS